MSSNGGKKHPWPQDEEDALRAHVAAGLFPAAIARAMGKTPNAIKAKLRQRGLQCRQPTAEERSKAASMAARAKGGMIAEPHADTIRRLAAEKQSGPTIAAATGLKRSAVARWCHKHGIKLDGRPKGQKKKEPKPRKQSAHGGKRGGKPSNLSGWSAAQKRTKVGKPAPIPLPVVPSCAPTVSIEKLNEFRDCRYIGDRPETFSISTPIYCGARTDGGPWCEEHRRIVSKPAADRERQDRTNAHIIKTAAA